VHLVKICLQSTEIVTFATASIKHIEGRSFRAESSGDEGVNGIRERLIVSLFQEIPAGDKHFFCVAGEFFAEQVDIAFFGEIEGVEFGAGECVVYLCQRSVTKRASE
jgi:hypothetical protein